MKTSRDCGNSCLQTGSESQRSGKAMKQSATQCERNARAKRILVIGPSWVGDMVMAQSLFQQLKVQSDCTIDVLAPAWSRALLDRMPEVNASLELPFVHGKLDLPGRYRLGKSLRKAAYDQVIVLPNSFKSALPAVFARIARRTGWRGEARGMLLNDCRVLDTQDYPLMVQRFVALALAPGAMLPQPLPRPRLHTEAGAVSQTMESLTLDSDRPVLALCPGAEFGDAKQWPAAHYAAVASRRLADSWQVWLLGSGRDAEVAQEVLENIPEHLRRHCHDLTGSTTLDQAIDLLSVAQAVVSNDSGLMHVAAALDRPLVVLYGSTSSDFTPPLADRVAMLATDIECRPCFQRRCPLKHKRCLTELSPSLVLKQLDTLAP